MRDRLVQLICDCCVSRPKAEFIANHLLEKGVIVAPMPMAGWLRKELTEYVHERCMEEL